MLTASMACGVLGAGLIGTTTLLAQAPGQDVITQLIASSPTIAAQIVIVILFLKHQAKREEAHERMVNRLTDSIDKLESRL